MFSLAIFKALDVYGIAIVISMLVAGLIKIMVVTTSRVKPVTKVAGAPKSVAQALRTSGTSSEVVGALSGALSTVTGPHRILRIAESKQSWAREGRAAQHSHQPRH